MKTQDVLQLDCRKEENKAIIQKVLRQIKPLSKFSDESEIPLSAIERAMQVMDCKYGIYVDYLKPDDHANRSGVIWRAEIKDSKTYKVLDMVYGLSMYEVLAKATIRIYAEVRSRKQV